MPGQGPNLVISRRQVKPLLGSGLLWSFCPDI